MQVSAFVQLKTFLYIVLRQREPFLKSIRLSSLKPSCALYKLRLKLTEPEWLDMEIKLIILESTDKAGRSITYLCQIAFLFVVQHIATSDISPLLFSCKHVFQFLVCNHVFQFLVWLPDIGAPGRMESLPSSKRIGRVRLNPCPPQVAHNHTILRPPLDKCLDTLPQGLAAILTKDLQNKDRHDRDRHNGDHHSR
mmetsp:Transcript_144612/g.277574  ORF Transcript_144612/g.277574 Transcript_144612/m.277574 type:complete len:195 (+) Transcript_144612:86-670(+)